MKLLFAIGLILLFSACMGDGMSDSYKAYLALHPEHELSDEEISFMDSLSSIGYKKVDILLPYAWDSQYYYYFIYSPPYKLTNKNIDSVKCEAYKLAKELFSKKVPNNILYETKFITVSPRIESDSIKKAFDYVRLELNAKEFFKDLGFKVVMNKDSTFSKVYLNAEK
jgi:hypothetical protein